MGRCCSGLFAKQAFEPQEKQSIGAQQHGSAKLSRSSRADAEIYRDPIPSRFTAELIGAHLEYLAGQRLLGNAQTERYGWIHHFPEFISSARNGTLRNRPRSRRRQAGATCTLV